MSNPTELYKIKNERLDAVLEQSMKLYSNGLEVVLKFKIDFSGVYAAGIVVPDNEKGYHAFDKDHYSYSLINGEKGDRIELAIPFPPHESEDYEIAGGAFDTKNDIPTRFYMRSKDAKKSRVKVKNEEIKKQEQAKADADSDASDTAGCFGIGMLMLLPPVLVAGYIDSQADGNNVFLPVFLVACVVWMSILSPIVGSMGSSRPRSSTARSIDNLTTYLVIRDIADRNSENNDFD